MEAAQKSTKRKDFLVNIEKEVQEMWWNSQAYEMAPDSERESYMGTFPYPYMNGRLHLGHAFTLSKVDFMLRYQRLQGKNALFPFSFHCTGMPIRACADHLKREMESGEHGQQYSNMQKMGIADEDIPDFADAQHWLRYFPPRAKFDLMRFGLGVDWRRSFITTDVNPYYDSFVRWQMGILREKIDYGKRHTVFSIADDQPCADHDRLSGEGVGPQEYTLIKIQILPPFKPAMAALEGFDVFLVAGTLRPETMVGQTNCFISPNLTYGAYEMKNGDVFICLERAAQNMAYQEMTKDEKQWTSLCDIKGEDLLGLPLKAPMCPHERVYSLPMMSISAEKATGIVTSVPSDAPDDFAALRDLKNKPELREKFGITEEMVNFDPIPILDIPGIGDLCAVTICEEMKIKSQNDKAKLAEAKEKAYKKGFNEGVMTAGPFAGIKVSEAKDKTRELMIEQGLAAKYWEPEKTVISRSRDTCIVALCNQWFLKYGDADWKAQIRSHFDSGNFTTYNSSSFHQFEETLEWLGEWACSRTYGLGTKIPWDETFLVESLSDSTIYMAYYTVSHLLQGGAIEGNQVGPIGITAEQMTADIWDYIFDRTDTAPTTDIPVEKLDLLRNEFKYWYPMDLRISGKDLIRNHLTMSLYNHAAVWSAKPEYMPRSFFVNGHSMLNDKKMSKAEGNFLTVNDCLDLYGADATRLVCADAGDTLDDANFRQENANAKVLTLTNFYEWAQKSYQSMAEMRTDEWTFFDHLFDNAINENILKTKEAYDVLKYRDVLKYGFFEMMTIRDEYKMRSSSVNMHKDLFLRYISAQLIIMAPIMPHFCEAAWKLHKEYTQQPDLGMIIDQKYPTESRSPDMIQEKQDKYIRELLKNSRNALDKAKGKKKDVQLKRLVIYIADSWPAMQVQVLELLQKAHASGQTDQKALLGTVKSNFDKSMMKQSMQFASFILTDYRVRGVDAFDTNVGFDEFDVVAQTRDYLIREFELEDLAILKNVEKHEADKSSINAAALPGKPTFYFYNSS